MIERKTLFAELRDGIAGSRIEEMPLEAWEFDREMFLKAQLATWKKNDEDCQMLSIYEAELEYEAERGRYEGPSEEFWEAERRASRKEKMETIPGYFHYIREPETSTYWTSSMIDAAADEEKAIRDLLVEEKRETELAALAEHLEYEHGYDADMYPDWFLLSAEIKSGN